MIVKAMKNYMEISSPCVLFTSFVSVIVMVLLLWIVFAKRDTNVSKIKKHSVVTNGIVTYCGSSSLGLTNKSREAENFTQPEAENADDSCFLPKDKEYLFLLDVEKFRKELLLGHNHYRELHGSQPLSLLQKLNDTAQQWAQHIAQKGYAQYSDSLLNTGESIVKIDLSEDNLNGKVLSMKWYKEIKNYSFAEPRWRRGAFHFTQMMWQNTTHLGVGLCQVPGNSGSVFVVVRYFPAGNSNMPGEFHRNVSPRMSVMANESRTSWNMEDDVIFRNSVSGRLSSRKSYTSSTIMDEAFV